MIRAATAFIVRITAIIAAIAPSPAFAHAFGARYDLPLPLWLYLTGAGATVALTFLLLALFSRSGDDGERTYAIVLPKLSELLSSTPMRWTATVISFGVFGLILITGLFGVQNPIENLTPTFVWVIWWVGFTFFVSLIANIWPAMNPWRVIADMFMSTLKQSHDAAASSIRILPTGLGVWPCVVFLGLFAWLEIVSGFGENPRILAGLIIAYSGLTWIGMALYGRDRWLATGELFHLYFTVLGRFAVFGKRNGEIIIRIPGSGLLQPETKHLSLTAFVILMLSIVTFDGFVETPLWAAIIEWLSQSQFMRPLLLFIQSFGIDLLIVVKTIALISFPLIFTGVFYAFCIACRTMAGGDVAVPEFANTLVYSLIPIAIAYHVSHYLSYLLLAGQLIIPLASDPFGWGWDLFGASHRAMDIGIINAATVWYVAIVAIVLGHVIAVWLAHEMALSLYRDSRLAWLSQIPMLVLMVVYTMTSLWILSQPIVEP